MTAAATIRNVFGASVALVFTVAQSGGVSTPNQMLGDETRPVDVVIALDTSGSMQNLLDATRARIWDVVNELGRMKPTLAVHIL